MFLLIGFTLFSGVIIGSIFVIFNDMIPAAFLLVLIGVLYPIGAYLFYHITSIPSDLVRNPLLEEIDEDFTMEKAINRMKRCKMVDSILVEYRTGLGEKLRIVSDVQVVLITPTAPQFSIRIPIENICINGPEFMCFLENISTRNSVETIHIYGNTALLSVKIVEKGTLISIRYDIIDRYVIPFFSIESCCNLLNAFLDEIKKDIPFEIVSKKSE